MNPIHNFSWIFNLERSGNLKFTGVCYSSSSANRQTFGLVDEETAVVFSLADNQR
jgi:hypothetical protein